MFLLETDFCIDWLRRKNYARNALAAVLPSDVAISVVTVGELLVGAHCAQAPSKEAAKVEAFLKPIPILDFGRPEAFSFAKISAHLRQQGQLIGVQDAMIAATAEVHQCTVVTKNLKHFQRVKRLQTVNWEAKPPSGTTSKNPKPSRRLI